MSNGTDLFVYGTLSFDGVLQGLLGYVPTKEALIVEGYEARVIYLEGWEPFPVMLKSQSSVKGFVLKNLTELDMQKLDRYEYVDEGYYTRENIQLSTSGRNITFYKPAENIFKVGSVGEIWDMDSLDPSLETTYVDSLVPNFIKDHPDLFGDN